MENNLQQVESQLGLALPTLGQPVNPTPPVLPTSWQCTALLHPFSPPPTAGTQTVPFYQLCLATIRYVKNKFMSVSILGEDGQSWVYTITVLGTELYYNGFWQSVDMGWSLPSTQWLTNATCVGSSYLNWMEAQMVDWWKMAAPHPVDPKAPASTWIWYNTAGPAQGFPFRMMFGQPPASPTQGDPSQLAFFQMYSFTYLCNLKILQQEPDPKDLSATVGLNGFVFGNPNNYEKVIWNSNFGMTTFMTPVNEQSNPLPTSVLYTWATDSNYSVLTDRAQNTLMRYNYNSGSTIIAQEALMFGIGPTSTNPPPNSGSSFLINYPINSPQITCSSMPLGQEAPNWAYAQGVDGTIHACVTNNAELCPNQTVTIISVLFPPSTEYPQGRYLWTWYSPLSGTPIGVHSRPVTFMESASTISEGGTSLALADYFDYQEFSQQLSPIFFQIPSACNAAQKS